MGTDDGEGKELSLSNYKRLTAIAGAAQLVAVPMTPAWSQTMSCGVTRLESGQLRNAGNTGSVKIDVKSGRYQIAYDEENKKIVISYISGDKDILSEGSFEFTGDQNRWSACVPPSSGAFRYCELDRKEFNGKSATSYIGNLKFMANESKVLSSSRWTYIDFYNDPYNDSFALNWEITGFCK